jgi:hypothetical protein
MGSRYHKKTARGGYPFIPKPGATRAQVEKDFEEWMKIKLSPLENFKEKDSVIKKEKQAVADREFIDYATRPSPNFDILHLYWNKASRSARDEVRNKVKTNVKMILDTWHPIMYHSGRRTRRRRHTRRKRS